MEFHDSGVKPVRASGTRWIAHKVSAMKRIVDKYGVYVQHLEHVLSDTSYRAKERARIQGYLKNWKTGKMLIHLCFYLDILGPAKELSVNFQHEKIDTVRAADALVNIKQKFQKIKDKKDVGEFPHIAYVKSKAKIEEGKFSYQGVTFSEKEVNNAINSCNAKKEREVRAVEDAIQSQLEDHENPFFEVISYILNSEGWERLCCPSEMKKTEDETDKDPQKKYDIEFADDHMKTILEHFKVPLEKAGLSVSAVDVTEE